MEFLTLPHTPNLVTMHISDSKSANLDRNELGLMLDPLIRITLGWAKRSRRLCCSRALAATAAQKELLLIDRGGIRMCYAFSFSFTDAVSMAFNKSLATTTLSKAVIKSISTSR